MKKPTVSQLTRLNKAFDTQSRGAYTKDRIDCQFWHYIEKDPDIKPETTMVSLHFPKKYFPSFQFHFDIFLSEWKKDVGYEEK
jgi:hypothetical protein